MPGLIPPAATEREMLLGFLDQQRYAVKLAAYRLSDDLACTASTPSTLSVAGLIKHLGSIERGWLAHVRLDDSSGGEEAYGEAFRLQPGETLARLIADYDVAASETRATIEGIGDLNQAVPVPKGVPWFPADLEAWTVRWVLLHLIEETARHAGHADIIREALDGATSYPLMAAAEGWEPTPWLVPWQPEPAAATG